MNDERKGVQLRNKYLMAQYEANAAEFEKLPPEEQKRQEEAATAALKRALDKFLAEREAR